MSTAAPRRSEQKNSRPYWILVRDGHDECFIPGSPGDWALYAELADIDGLPAYQTREKLSSLVVETGERFLSLTPPEPTQFFSFTRARTRLYEMTLEPDYALSNASLEEWLFTVFGYLTNDVRVFLTVLPTHVEMHCEPRSMPFTLVS